MSKVIITKSAFDKRVIKIERAVPDDAQTICNIRDRAWVKSYPNKMLGITAEQITLNAKGLGGEFVPRRIAYLKKQCGKISDNGLDIYVAKIDGKVVGYVEPCIDEHGHQRINAIYVDPEAQRKGVGGELMRQALSVLGRDRDIYLDVVSYNQNAIDFYKHFGFEKTDAKVAKDKEAPDYMVSLPEIEMVLRAVD